MSGRKETGKKGTTEKAAGRKVSNQGDAKRRSNSEAVIEGTLRTERVFMGYSILRKTDRTLSKGEYKTRVEHIILSGILPVMRGRGATYRNCKN